MIDGERLGGVVDRIYEAAARPELWRNVLNEMAEVTQAKGVQMLHHRPEGAVLHASSEGMDEVLRAFFAEGWNRDNPREVRARLRGMHATEAITDRDLFTPEELDREPWQRDFLDRFGLRWFCTFGLRPVIEPGPFMLTIERLAKTQPFDDGEVALIAGMIPHVQRAVRMSTALGAAARSGMMDAFTALSRPAVLLDDLGRVVSLNESADGVIGDGVTISGGRLHATNRAADGPLQALLGSVCWAGAACRAPPVDAVALPRRAGRPLILQAAPLVNSARDLFQHARALVLINPLDRPVQPDEMLLRYAFGLTPMEARLARVMAEGGGIAAAARALGVSAHTARTHLKAIFAKTDTHSQSQLAVLLSRLTVRMEGEGAIRAASPK